METRKTLAEMEQNLPESKARDMLVSLFDENTFSETGKFVGSDGATEGLITGFGTVSGGTVYAFAQDVSVKSGAMTKASANKLKKLYNAALRNGCPIVGVYDSKGGDITEGQELLNAYGEIANLSAKASGVVPQIAVVTGICAGATAVIACMADILIMSQDGELFMTAPFIAPDGKLKGAGKAENAAKSGVAAIVAKDAAEAIEKASDILSRLPLNNIDCGMFFAPDGFVKPVSGTGKAEEFVKDIADDDSVCELYKDFGTSAYTAFATICDSDVGIVTTDKTADKLTMADTDKIARFVSLCDAFSIPVITVLDSEGFAPCAAAELSGSIRSAARLTQLYAGATTQKICLIKGNAIAQSYIALGGAAAGNDYVIAYGNAVISPLAPSAAAVFLHGNEGKSAAELDKLAKDYAAKEASVFEACSNGFADEITEPENVRETLIRALSSVEKKRVSNPPKKHINYAF